MPPAARGQSKAQKERSREGSQHLPNRNTAPATAIAPQGQSRSGTTTPDASSVQTPATSASSSYVPAEVREYMHSKWQKYYDDALAQAKSPNANVVLLGSQSAGQSQQGWNNVGGKSGGKGGNPWGTQNRHLTAKGVPFLQHLKSAIEEQNNPQKGG